MKKVDECRVHDFEKLIRIAGLKEELNDSLKTSAAAGGEFVRNWDAVREWKVESRYVAKTEAEARKLYTAISEVPNGVLPWLKEYW